MVKRVTLTILLILFAFGIAHGDFTPKQKSYYYTPLPLNIFDSNSPIGNLNSLIIFLADQIGRNVDIAYFKKPIIISTFVNLDNLKEASSFGRLVAENLIHELQVRKWRVLDIRLVKEIIINGSGEFSLSRDIQKIRDTYEVGGIVTGTYTFTNDAIVINARVIDIDTGLVVSSAQFPVPFNGLEELFFKDSPPRAMKIVNGGSSKESFGWIK